MTKNIKHLGLTLGLFLSIISFLFFGRHQGLYMMFLFSGLLISLVFYLTILFGGETAKSKIQWTIIVVLAATFQWQAKPILIQSSFLIYLKNHDKELCAVNRILMDKQGVISIHNDYINDKQNLLTKSEKDSLVKFQQELNVYLISKSDDGIYYALWGFLDTRIGITYWTKNELPNGNLKRLKDGWYR